MRRPAAEQRSPIVDAMPHRRFKRRTVKPLALHALPAGNRRTEFVAPLLAISKFIEQRFELTAFGNSSAYVVDLALYRLQCRS